MANVVEIIVKATDKASGAITGMFAKINNSGLGKAVQSLTGLNLASVGAGGAVVALGKFMLDTAKNASDLNETVSKTKVVFGDSAQGIIRFGENAATAMGMSENAALSAMATYGNLFRSMGMAEEQSASMSTELVQLAADLASFNNLDPSVVFEKLRAGLTGEAEPLKTLGININETILKTKAMELGLYDGVGALDASTKATAAYKLMMEQTTLAQGDFARTSDGMSNQQRILAAEIENLKASIGEIGVKFEEFLIPILSGAAEAFNTLISFNELYTGAVSNATDEMLRQGVAYEEYAKRLAGAAREAGKMTERERVYYKQILSGEYSDPKWMQEINSRLDILSDSEYEASRGALKLKDAFDLQMQNGMVWDTNINQWVVDIAKLGDQSTLTAEEIEAAAKMESAARSEMYTTVTSLAQGLTDSEKELKEAEQDLAEYIKSNPWDNKGISDRRDAVNKLKQEQSEMVDQWLLDVYTQMITADGDLSEADMAFLLQYQVTTGMITQENADRAQSYYDQAQRILESNGLIQGSIDSIHGKDVFVNVYSNTVSGQYGSGIGVTENRLGKDLNGNGRIGFSNGGSFVIGSGYGYEGFDMGGVATASAGETVTIEKAGQNNNNDALLAAIKSMPRMVARELRQLEKYG